MKKNNINSNHEDNFAVTAKLLNQDIDMWTNTPNVTAIQKYMITFITVEVFSVTVMLRAFDELMLSY